MAIYKGKVTLYGKEVIIRNAEEKDAEVLLEYLRTVYSETTYLAREPGELSLTADEEREFISVRKNDPLSLFLVAEIVGEIVGTCGNTTHQSLREKHKASIGLAVKKSFWGIGIGSVLLKHQIEWCRGAKFESIYLKVNTDNERAVRLYKKFGFVVEGTLKHDFKLADGTYKDCYYMKLFL